MIICDFCDAICSKAKDEKFFVSAPGDQSHICESCVQDCVACLKQRRQEATTLIEPKEGV